jgi:hypothetical protein
VSATVFHGYDIVGRTEIADAEERRELLRALARGACDGGDYAGLCFNPRHGLHIENSGHSIDLLICFEFFQAHTYGFCLDDKIAISGSAQKAFDASLHRHEVPVVVK